jgi:hypothetical protein
MPLFRAEAIPVLNNVTYGTREDAERAAVGDVALHSCGKCGFVFNREFNPGLVQYDDRYNNSRKFSDTFNAYSEKIVDEVVPCIPEREVYLELGCGDGDFLRRICEKGYSRGIGYDPALEQQLIQPDGSVQLMKGFFPEGGERYKVIVLRHLLEHISTPAQYIREVVASRQAQNGKLIIEVPDFEDTLAQGYYFDLTYEHCNYFIRRSLSVLLEQNGYTIDKCINVFSNQYLLCVASFNGASAGVAPALPAGGYDNSLMQDRKARLEALVREKSNVVVWGASGKGVIFLCSLPGSLRKKVDYVVDINPHKHGQFTASAGLQIHPPTVLHDKPETSFFILVMNSIYRDEIAAYLEEHHINAELHCV